MTPQDPIPEPSSSSSPEPLQRVVKVRRDYNTWVANETIEDYALRFTPRGFRRWTELRVANTAFGAASFLVLEAVGATLLVRYGFTNAFWAILATGLIIFLAGLPISLYAARYGIDMDLLTRGAGFGYMGSTVTSLIYASFTFIFFALEAAIMAYALDLAFGIPPALGYLICALAVIPLVTHGVTAISRLQTLSQPLWLAMLLLPYIFVLYQNPGLAQGLTQYGGEDGSGKHFDVFLFGAALTLGVALITQMGEQADYLRFMPERTVQNRRRWLVGTLIGGTGWVLPGVAKMLGGALLAFLAISNSVPPERAVDPNQMYLAAWEYVFPHPAWAVAATVLFVVISQLKINVTNAYAGSLAWSNFFARLTHSHPGRLVWMVFNTLVALVLMELDLFQALGQVLGLYSNIAISWMMTVVADLVINKPLGLSPPGIEFRRAHLYDINPVGVGAMGLASLLSVSAYLGAFGPGPQAFSAAIAMATAFIAAPVIAWATGGRYYIARTPEPAPAGNVARCCICDKDYESDDMARCPAYQGTICSLCCSLDARCDDFCKPQARFSAQWAATLRRFLPRAAWPYLDTGLGHYLLLMVGIVPFLALMLGLLYQHELHALGASAEVLRPHLDQAFIKAYAAFLLVSGIVAWWLVLTQQSRRVAQEESNRQTMLLMQEIESHRRTDEQLQRARLVAEQANQAKSRYITAVSHELRTPLNSILGYAQIMDGDPAIPEHRRRAVSVIRRSGDHLLSLIEGTLDIARIEGGRLTLDIKALDFDEFLKHLVRMFEVQAQEKGIGFHFEALTELPAVVRSDEKRLRQVLLNILGNAVKFTAHGSVSFRVRYAREMANFEIQDTGPGIGSEDQARIFEPFVRGAAAAGGAGGAGLGLTISRMLTALMGGEMALESTPGQGSLFRIRLYLPAVDAARAPHARPHLHRTGYLGEQKRILVVDNEVVDRELLANILEPLGFELALAASGVECLERAPVFEPHLIFMDLAMPGIDGWETIRCLQQDQHCRARIAVVSANAFEKGLRGAEPDGGVAAEDFITKPVRVEELLDWIGRALDLEWIEGAPSPTPSPTPPPIGASLAYPDDESLESLAEVVELGYVRGIQRKLDEIEAASPECAEFVRLMRKLAGQYQFDAMILHIRKERDDPPA